MQVYARDRENKKVSIHLAARGQDYHCLECGSRVRARMGTSLKAHFYHLSSDKACRQAAKSEEHLYLQKLISQQIGQSLTVEEMRFDTIGRVADVAWLEMKCVFEVQCSPISGELLQSRTEDYESLGWEVIWIFHEKNFLKKKLTQAERSVQNKTHYYTDGKRIYDVLQVTENGTRQFVAKSDSIQVDTLRPFAVGAIGCTYPQLILTRASSWKYFAMSDYLWNALHADSEEWQGVLRVLWYYDKKQTKNALVRPTIQTFRALWHFVLERSCH